MNSELEASYDLVPYPALAHFHTRPDRLQSIGLLLGMTPPPAETAKVLELGCGTGMNLVGLAYRNPGAQFLGIDLSGDQIRLARQAAAALELRNIEFRHQSLAEFKAAPGSYDYILAHGLFSWVSDDIREQILQLCQDLLSPSGLAYISFNTLPGWYQNLWVRDMMAFASSGEAGHKKIPKAKDFLALVAQSPFLDAPPKATLQQSLKSMDLRDEAYLLHDFLEINNQPMFFQDFMELASRHGLQYLADAEVNFLIQADWPPAFAFGAQETELIRQEQLSDFLRHRTFRKSLLCRNDVALDRANASSRIEGLSAVSFLRQEAGPGPSPVPGATRFSDIGGKGGLFLAPSALHVAVLELERAFPHAIPVCDLLERARAAGFPEDAQRFANQLLELWQKGYVDLLKTPPDLPKDRGDRPMITPLARYQAQSTAPLTNLSHAPMNVKDAFRRLIPAIDGTRTETELAQWALQEGIVAKSPQLDSAEQLSAAIKQVQRFLDWCMQSGLLLH